MADPLTQKVKDAIAARKLLEEERQTSLAALQAKDQPTQEAIQAKLGVGQTTGEQTRGGKKLSEQTAQAGKELIGMRSGVPIYADTAEVYGAPKTLIPATIAKEGIEIVQTPEQQRAEYQASAAPKAAAAMAPQKQTTTYWSPEYAKAYDQAVAREAALARVGGAEEATRRAAESEASSKVMAGFTKTIGREVARKQIEAGTASPETIAKYPELNPLRSIAKPDEQDFGATLPQPDYNLLVSRFYRKKAK